MSNIKAFIDYSMEDNGSAAREALYADIHDRVMGAIEAKKMELAGGMLTREEKECGSDMDDLKTAKKKVKKLKEELALMEESGCDMDSDDYAEKKKKLKKAKKKVKKLKEQVSITEGEEDEIDENVKWSGEESVEQIDEISKRLVGNALRKANHNAEMDYDDGGDGSKWGLQADRFKSYLQKKSPKNEIPGRGTSFQGWAKDPLRTNYSRSDLETPTKSGKIHKSTQKSWAKGNARTLRGLQNQPKPNLPE